MSTSFPSGLDSFTNPASTDSLATVNHASQHDNINDAMAAVQAKVGVNGSAVTTSLDYKLAHLAESNAGYFPAGVVGTNTPVITTMDRSLVTSAVQNVTTQRLVLIGFVAPANLTVNNAAIFVTTADAAVNVTVGQVGVYSLDNSNNGTRMAQSTNNTSLFAATGRAVQALSSSATLVQGSAYAFALLGVFSTGSVQVAGGAAPLNTNGPAALIGTGSMVPFIMGVLTGQSSLPASFTAASLVTTGSNPFTYAELF